MSHGSLQLARVVSRDPEIRSGDLVFTATRVPVEALIDYLKSDYSVENFLKDFPTVGRCQVEAFVEFSSDGMEHLRVLKRTV